MRRPRAAIDHDGVVALDERDRQRLAAAAVDGELLREDLLAGGTGDERVRARIDLDLRDTRRP